MPPTVSSLDHLVPTVSNIAVSLQFYTEILGLQGQKLQAADGSFRHGLVFGQQKINLHLKGSEFEPKAALAAPGTADLCFLTTTPLQVWKTNLQANGIPLEYGPVARTDATGPILSVYLRDPGRNLIEISTSI